jgi:thiamine kinase-like enzyme
VSAVAPSLATRASALLLELELRAPEVRALVPSHGDFHGGQLLELGNGHAIIDFDLLCAAAPALDIANYAGHLVAQESYDIAAGAAVLDDLVEGYGRRPADLSWYLSAALLWFTRGPFKRFEDGWPVRMERTLGAAEDALRL